MSLRNKIKIVELTDTGKIREHNEDAIGTDKDLGLLVLADGMGGYNAGEVASGIAVKTVLKQVAKSLQSLAEDRDDVEPQTGLWRQSVILRDAVARGNKLIHNQAQIRPECEGMGTTLVACLFYNNHVSVAHVGDSRMYRLRDGRFEQITLDHSLLQELVDRGFYSQEEAQRSTNRNYVTRALGVEKAVEVEINEYEVKPGDYYLLCSDGLTDMVEDEDIHLTISTFHDSLDTAGQQLVKLANDHGGKDNISVVIGYVAQSFGVRKGLLKTLARKLR
ncbi:MAG: Stp1/IreP family PP2C-type Ser/Thr phosphatase [Gammaproteobacteria bacterium]|jgi:protein phosphatase|nr:Stp1/IreP family PP2C-type Ser/Thr phosphatase [Gammaproteobacteria bacterium]